MKKNALLVCVLAVLAFIAAGCEDGDTPPAYTENTLAGTNWTLVEFVDVEAGTSREPEYSLEEDWNGDKDKMYRLLFVDDTLVKGHFTLNGFQGTYIVSHTNNMLMLQLYSTLICCEPDDTELYSFVLRGAFGILRFEQYPETLHIFYNGGKEYLKFKKIEGVSGGGW